MQRSWLIRFAFFTIVGLSCLHLVDKMESDASVLAQATIPYRYFVPLAPVNPTQYRTTRVSVASDGTEANNSSYAPSISANGHFVAFQSVADNLVDDDTNDSDDIFVHDRQTGETTRVSVTSDGSQASDSSSLPAISDDGRYVAFTSAAADLIDDDANGLNDIFVHDRETGEIERVSISSDGDEANNGSDYASISEKGRFVAFLSDASNLVDGDTNNALDVFVHDRKLQTTERVSVDSDGRQSADSVTHASMSANGRFVGFTSRASDLVPGDTNGVWDVFVHDRETDETTRVSVASDGTQANRDSLPQPSLSRDGRYVAFTSFATNLVDDETNGVLQIFIHDQLRGETTLISVALDGEAGDRDSRSPDITGQGDRVAFSSYAENLIDRDINRQPDIFVRNWRKKGTRLASITWNGVQSNHAGLAPSIAAWGGYVAYESRASNLVPDDTNDHYDIFVYDLTE